MNYKITDAEMIAWIDMEIANDGNETCRKNLIFLRERFASLTPTKDAEELSSRITFKMTRHGDPDFPSDQYEEISVSEDGLILIQSALTVAEQRGFERGKAEAVPDGWQTMDRLPTDDTIQIAVRRRNGAPMFGSEMVCVYACHVDDERNLCDAGSWNIEPSFGNDFFETFAWQPLAAAPSPAKPVKS